MLDALFKAFGQVMQDQLAQAEHRMFIGTLFTGSEQAALERLRERVQTLDDSQFDAFMQTAQAMLAEAHGNLQQVEASGGNDAWGGSFEDRMALMAAQIQTGDRSASNARVQQAQTAVAGMAKVIELAGLYRAQHSARDAAHALAPAPAAPDQAGLEAMLDEVGRTGQMPDGFMEALSQVQDPALLERLVAKLKALGGEAAGDRPLDDIMDYYRDGEGKYDLLWPLATGLPMAFHELDRQTQFHVLFAECRRRLTEGSSLRNGGRLDDADAAFNECLVRAAQIEVPILKSDAYQGLMSNAEKRGDRKSARRYMELAQAERERQDSLRP